MTESGIDFDRCFAAGYEGARVKFAEAAGGRVVSYVHPDRSTAAGHPLAIEVAHLGETSGTRQLVIISGTHGVEGAAGSAAQVAWMLSGGARSLPRDLGVLLIHALNPFGFANECRTNESNVDLNRNFVDHAAGRYPTNPGYDGLHADLILSDWTRRDLARTWAALRRYSDEHGEQALRDVLVRGQYTHGSGLIYGGNRREWSNLMFERIVAEHLGSARKIGLIDWHTGIGAYADLAFLCFNEEGGDLHERAAAWWGADRIGTSATGARPRYSGLVFDGLRGFLGERPMCGAVVEFGTRGPGMQRALLLDHWLRFAADRESERYALLREDMIDAFRPVDQRWRDAVVDLGAETTARAVEGLARW